MSFLGWFWIPIVWGNCIKAGVSNTRPAMLFGSYQIINIYVYKCLEKRCREIIESKLEDTQCGLRPGSSSKDQIFTLQQIFEKRWEYAKDVYTWFLEKAYDRIHREKLWGMLLEYGVDGRLLLGVKQGSHKCNSKNPESSTKKSLFYIKKSLNLWRCSIKSERHDKSQK